MKLFLTQWLPMWIRDILDPAPSGENFQMHLTIRYIRHRMPETKRLTAGEIYRSAMQAMEQARTSRPAPCP